MPNPSITTWTRLEPNPLSDNMTPSLEACVYDPAWMIARQWQIGEFHGEDAGTPIDVSIEVNAAPLVTFQTKNGNYIEIKGVPLENLAGAEQKGELLPFEVAEAGMEFLNICYENNISNKVIENIVNEFPLKRNENDIIDSTGEYLLDLLEGCSDRMLGLPNVFSLDKSGYKTLEEMLRNTQRNKTPDSKLNIPSNEADAFVKVACEWIEWFDSFMYYSSDQEDSWDNERMEYSFKAEARDIKGTSIIFKADEWNGSQLDWYSMDIDDSNTEYKKLQINMPKLIGMDDSYKKSHQGLPTMLTYQGMPCSRWWEFEDAQVNFAQIDCEKNDIARMLVVEFACAYGNDWYLIPMELPIGAIYTIKNFKVKNTFGEEQEIFPVSGSSSGDLNDWCLFNQSYSNNKKTYQGLLLYPRANIDKSEAIEQVEFFRDEMANMAWAVEKHVESSDGRKFDRNRNYTSNKSKAVTDKDKHNSNSYTEKLLEYKLVSEIPQHFFPLVPKAPITPASKPEHIYQMLLMSSDLKPFGEILNSSDDINISQEEIPAEGIEVTRNYMVTRCDDGKTLLCRIKQKKTGRGEGSSGLEYDKAE
ncbi:hypothetical protein EHE19_009635 [Ruminiclostridium herbifermentans]|uniref:Uncharacterized protein n=1 Tax=Ruminiclostridium herbifermentans TaxID=2488810 RepID=A0A4U7JJ15_9FIRM|nr:hypothetical protein [Ruminiclostridium herbifermentans]QNU68629.1 hypothetical protein EHE19_009635 [Ruminiclostridium herbifermentans]